MERIVFFILLIIAFSYSCNNKNNAKENDNSMYYSLNYSQKQLMSELNIMFLQLQASSKFSDNSTISKLLSINNEFQSYDELIVGILNQDSLSYKNEINIVNKRTQELKNRFLNMFQQSAKSHFDTLLINLDFEKYDYSNSCEKKMFYAKKRLDLQILRYNFIMIGLNNFSNSSIKYDEPTLLFQSISDTIYNFEKHINYVFFGVNYMKFQQELYIDSVFRDKINVDLPMNVFTLQNSLKKVVFSPKEVGNYRVKGRIVFKFLNGTFREVPFQKTFVVKEK